MKRILFILALAVMATSCFGPEWEQPSEDFFVREFTYNGHNYIEFKDNTMYGQGYVHDPDCPCHHQVAQTLSEWDKMILAISYTESRWNPDAIGLNHDSGHLQLTGPYLSEINRIYKTDYTLEDAFDPETAIKLFTMMQEYYNKDHDIQSAIYYHNKADYYRDAVMENMILVERYEAIRKILVEK